MKTFTKKLYYSYKREKKSRLFNYNFKQIHYIPCSVGRMAVKGGMEGVRLLFEIKYSGKFNFLYFSPSN